MDHNESYRDWCWWTYNLFDVMKRPGKYLSFYYECLDRGYIPLQETVHTTGGLCSVFPNNKKLMRFEPNDLSDGYWGWGRSDYSIDSWTVAATEFTPLRQTIVLFMAAMNNEL